MSSGVLQDSAYYYIQNASNSQLYLGPQKPLAKDLLNSTDYHVEVVSVQPASAYALGLPQWQFMATPNATNTGSFNFNVPPNGLCLLSEAGNWPDHHVEMWDCSAFAGPRSQLKYSFLPNTNPPSYTLQFVSDNEYLAVGGGGNWQVYSKPLGSGSPPPAEQRWILTLAAPPPTPGPTPSGLGCNPNAVPSNCPAGYTCSASGACIPQLVGCDPTVPSTCLPGFECKNGVCVPKACTSNADCGPGQQCSSGTCSPSPTPAPTHSPTKKPGGKGLSTGAIIGIVAAGVVVLGLLIWALTRKKKNKPVETKTTVEKSVPSATNGGHATNVAMQDGWYDGLDEDEDDADSDDVW